MKTTVLAVCLSNERKWLCCFLVLPELPKLDAMLAPSLLPGLVSRANIGCWRLELAMATRGRPLQVSRPWKTGLPAARGPAEAASHTIPKCKYPPSRFLPTTSDPSLSSITSFLRALSQCLLRAPSTPFNAKKPSFQMPNVSFDIFYDLDFINITATRSGAAPKIKPAWKVRTAPKLPPKELPAPSKSTARPDARPKINAQRSALKEHQGSGKKPPKLGPKAPKEAAPSETASQAGDPPKKAPPKLKDLPKKSQD